MEFRKDDSTVWLDLYSVSRGSGVLGKVGHPSFSFSFFTLSMLGVDPCVLAYS